jgi:ribonuclease HI
MNHPTPHYVLMAEASRNAGFGRWRFALRPVDGSDAVIEAADTEPDTWGERLDLLTVLRALESLDQPSRVTLIGCSRYVEQGILYGLAEWRENDWRWEYFGQMAPVRDADLWQRMDRVLQFHRVECSQRRFDAGHNRVAGPHWSMTKGCGNWVDRIVGGNWLKYCVPLVAAWCGVWMETASRFWHLSVRTVTGYSSSFLVHRS